MLPARNEFEMIFCVMQEGRKLIRAGISIDLFLCYNENINSPYQVTKLGRLRIISLG
jgi:hypothetical protein